MKRLVLVLGLLVVFVMPCRGTEVDLWQSMGGEGILDTAGQFVPELDLAQSMDLDRGLAQLGSRVMDYLPKAVREVLGSSLLLLVIVLLCAIAQGLRPNEPPGGICTTTMAGALAITAVAANDVNGMIGLGKATLDSIQSFSQVFLPVMAACSAATGHAGAGAARQMATAVFCNILITLIDKVLVVLAYGYIAACTAYAAIGNQGLKRMAELVRWVITKTLSLLLIAFVTYLTMTGTVAGGVDAAALKATKTVIATLIPVVGRIISDASETLVVGAGVVKNTVGVIGVVVVLGLCLVPFLQLVVHYLGYRLSAALSATVAESRLWELISGLGNAFGLILAMVGSCAVMMLVSILSTMAGGG